MELVPLRGSGWVCCSEEIQCIKRPTRYREVVLTPFEQGPSQSGLNQSFLKFCRTLAPKLMSSKGELSK